MGANSCGLGLQSKAYQEEPKGLCLALVALVVWCRLVTGGKPSTWLLPRRLVEPRSPKRKFKMSYFRIEPCCEQDNE